MKLVAVDYGLARTGLAATDPDGILAYPLETIRLDSFPNRRAFLDALAARVLREKPAAVRILESYLHSPSSATLAEGDGYRAG